MNSHRLFSVLFFIRQLTGVVAQVSQFPLTSVKNRPCVVVQTQFDDAYSSGAPKMWPVSWPNTLSIDHQFRKDPVVWRMTTLAELGVA